MLKSVLERAKFAAGVKTDVAFADFLGVYASTIVGYKQRGQLPLEQCIKIAKQTGVSLDWLILGKGAPDGGSTDTAGGDAVPVPLYDVYASAGAGIEVGAETVCQYVPFDAGWLRREQLAAKDLLCVFVRGDSMLPTLGDMDVVLVNRAKTSGDGIFVVSAGGVLRVKRLQWLLDGKIRISSDNPIYNAEIVDAAELGVGFFVVGACHTRICRVG